MNYNKLLNVQPGASAKEIQQAYRKAAKEVHPDHSKSPEAAEAFQRIREAREKLLQQAEAGEAARDANAIQHSTAAAVKATTQAAFRAPSTLPTLTDEEIKEVQDLDQKAAEKPKRSLFGRILDPKAVLAHRKKIRRNNRRLDGKY